uniref:ATP-binding cassette, sub-family member 2 n=1 Tax=Mus musculus TaxID=10090 RepID=Q3UNY3_MOUSE|nr:unnamed protein product [Mus musculus]
MFLIYLAISKVAFQDSGLSKESVQVCLSWLSLNWCPILLTEVDF